jgi:DNA-binding NarL/FixJ family response regulator
MTFSAAIMDLTIPGGMGGKETAQQILEFDPKACLIVSSGYSNDSIISDYSSYGFSGSVAKPYSINELGQQLSLSLSTRCHETSRM